MHIPLGPCELRSWRAADLHRLVRYADNRRIWRNLRDRFPSPYTEAVGAEWLRHALAAQPETNVVIAVDDELVGAIGATLGTDIHRRTAEIGYWIGEEFWGRGLATTAVRGFTRWLFDTYDLVRIWAGVFDWNPASGRVLEKAGFRFESRMARSAFKDGQVVDELAYVQLRGEATET